MERLTHERCNGIKTGYWSPEKKAVAEACKIYKSTLHSTMFSINPATSVPFTAIVPSLHSTMFSINPD